VFFDTYKPFSDDSLRSTHHIKITYYPFSWE